MYLKQWSLSVIVLLADNCVLLINTHGRMSTQLVCCTLLCVVNLLIVLPVALHLVRCLPLSTDNVACLPSHLSLEYLYVSYGEDFCSSVFDIIVVVLSASLGCGHYVCHC